jgi:FeS assembly SUF system protein
MSSDQISAFETREAVIEAIKKCYDPEIPVNIYELGLIYGVHVDDEGRVRIHMTLTSPMCPVAEELPYEVQTRVRAVEGVSEAVVELVWDPPWDPSRMSEAARLELGF